MGRPCLFAVSHNKSFCESLNPTHVVRVNNGAFVLENCYGLTDADFEHEEQTGDATARALAEAATNAPSSTGTDVVEEEKERGRVVAAREGRLYPRERAKPIRARIRS